jgi:RNA-directed DNA polymerase
MPRLITPVRLSQNDEELKAGFSALASRASVAALLGVSERDLVYLLYRGGKKYESFDLPKKSGGMRRISAPTSSIKILQKRLNQVLRTVYAPRSGVHGFTLGRSIVTNADRHVKKRLVLNIDLEDFFPCIHFGRVRGMFASAPYNLPVEVAQVLAQVCTHEGRLPQGAPTSPIVSNIVCAPLDTGLRTLAQSHGCTYTRYADDITFSTTRKHFLKLSRESFPFPVRSRLCISGMTYVGSSPKTRSLSTKKRFASGRWVNASR